jgi:hypothetical protein
MTTPAKPQVTAEQVGHFLSEWLDDHAPLNERRYVIAVENLAKRYPELGIEVRAGTRPRPKCEHCKDSPPPGHTCPNCGRYERLTG